MKDNVDLLLDVSYVNIWHAAFSYREMNHLGNEDHTDISRGASICFDTKGADTQVLSVWRGLPEAHWKDKSLVPVLCLYWSHVSLWYMRFCSRPLFFQLVLLIQSVSILPSIRDHNALITEVTCHAWCRQICANSLKRIIMLKSCTNIMHFFQYSYIPALHALSVNCGHYTNMKLTDLHNHQKYFSDRGGKTSCGLPTK